MASHSSILAWKIPGTEEPGRLESKGWQRIRHNVATEHRQFLQVLLLVFKIMPLREEFLHMLFIQLTVCLGAQ